MSNVAILFTGAYRTFDKTYQCILDNMLKPNSAKAFIFCESNISTYDFQQMIESRWNGYVGSVKSNNTTRTKEFEAILEYLIKW